MHYFTFNALQVRSKTWVDELYNRFSTVHFRPKLEVNERGVMKLLSFILILYSWHHCFVLIPSAKFWSLFTLQNRCSPIPLVYFFCKWTQFYCSNSFQFLIWTHVPIPLACEQSSNVPIPLCIWVGEHSFNVPFPLCSWTHSYSNIPIPLCIGWAEHSLNVPTWVAKHVLYNVPIPLST